MSFFKKKISVSEHLDTDNLPVHVGIIMDGNGRWAKKRNMPRVAGHNAGMLAAKRIIRFASDIGIKAVTLYAFSTENWKRPKDEVSAIMNLLAESLRREFDEMHANGVVIRSIGDENALPESVKSVLDASMEKTKNNGGLVLNLALNYGSRAEIVRAVKKIAQSVKNGEISPEDIDEAMISENLDTCGCPDPDLIIRTSGEQRVSNFMMYQSAYSEFYFTDTYWPDFDEQAFTKALIDFQNRKRRFGGI